MKKLGVNIDHVATLRQARRASEPDPVHAALAAEAGGAHQITVHLREDRRHIQDRDVRILREVVKTRLNLEMAATAEMVKVALNIKPDRVTLVPERREELTTEGGLEVTLNRESLAKTISILREGDIEVNLFIDPDIEQVKASHMIKANGIEFHTGKYSRAKKSTDVDQEFKRVEESTRLAKKTGLFIAAGHGLDYLNIQRLCGIEAIEEFNIGHSIIARSVFVGVEKAVADMVTLLRV